MEASTYKLDSNDQSAVDSNGAAILHGADADPTQNLLYPVSSIPRHEPGVGNVLYIAALASNDDIMNTAYAQYAGDDSYQPNWEQLHKYGSSFHLAVLKFANPTKDSEGTWTGDMELVWRNHFPVDADPTTGGEIPSVWIGGMLLQTDSSGVDHL